MRRLFFATILLVVFVSTSFAFSLEEWRNSIYDQIKIETLRQLKDMTQRDITVGKVSGVVVGQVVFDEVTIPDFAFAKKVTVNFNPVQYLIHRGDVVPAITKIVIEDGEFLIERNSKDKWNFNGLLPPEDPNAPPPPPFRARLVFKNCSANYVDALGFQAKPQKFNAQIDSLDGSINFGLLNRVGINLSGNIKDSKSTIKGSFNLKSGKYKIKVWSNHLKLADWVKYTVPIEGLSINDGHANIKLTLTPAKLKGWPLSLDASYELKGANGSFNDFAFSDLSGTIKMKDADLDFKGLKVQIDQLPIEANGNFAGFSKLDLDLTLNKGKLYNQPLSGKAKLGFSNNILSLDLTDVNFHQGKLKGLCKINFKASTPNLQFNGQLIQINLASLANQAPGIEGYASGQVDLLGPIDHFKGELNTKLNQGLLFGQPIDELVASFGFNRGNVYIENLNAKSKTATVNLVGNISKDLNLDFKATARGIKLSGQGVLGTMEALAEEFKGNVSFKLDDRFLAAPLKHLNAEGEATLSQGRVGQQQFDFAQGKITLGQGLIQIKDVIFKQRDSEVSASGQTGIGVETNLTIHSPGAKLEDLKILNYILPKVAQDPSGIANFKIAITGNLSNETELTALNASCQIKLKQTEIAEVPIHEGEINFEWQDQHFSISRCNLFMPDSYVSFDAAQEKQGRIKGNAIGSLDLNLFKKITKKYGELSGRIALNLAVKGKAFDPQIGANIIIEDLNYNNFQFDSVKGAFSYYKNQLFIDPAIRLEKDKNLYEIKGYANLKENYIALKVKALESNVASILNIAENIRAEYYRRFAAYDGQKKIDLKQLKIAFPKSNTYQKKGQVVIYTDKSKNFFLKAWEELATTTTEETFFFSSKDIGGQVQGNISLIGYFDSLTGEVTCQVNDGYYKQVKFNDLKAKAAFKNNKISFSQLELGKDRGKLSATGNIGFDSKIDLQVKGNNFPLETLKLFFDEEFSGDINLNANIKGELINPDFGFSINGNNIGFSDIIFDRIKANLTKLGPRIEIAYFQLAKDNKISSLEGYFQTTTPGKINLKAELYDDAFAVLNLFSKEAKWLKGGALARLTVTGNFEQPDVDGELEVENASVFIKALKSPVEKITGKASIRNNLLRFRSINGLWQSSYTKKYPNHITLAGNIDLSNIFPPKNQVELNIALTPANYYINLPNLYTGGIKIKSFHLYGPLSFDLATGPTLNCEAEIENAVVYLSNKDKGQKAFPLNLALDLKLKKNVYAVMGNVWTTDLSNIFINLEVSSDDLKVSGSLGQPSLLGKINIKRGTVNIFNREFSLLNTIEQKQFYSMNAEKISDNIAIFSGEKGKEGVMPEVRLTAKVDVDNTVTDASGQKTKEKVTIVSRINGVLGSKDKDESLKVSFDSFKQQNNQYLAAGYSDQEIKVMLLPDFIKSLTGIDDDTEVDSNAVVADYLNSRLQTIVFRGVERELEQRLGLESLTLEYNFGKDIRHAMGVPEADHFDEQKPDWRVGFVKGFFDRFYVQIRYSQTTVDEGGVDNNFLDYELTYKLTSIWSIIYYREPVSLLDPTTSYQKLTLQAGFSFW